MQEDKLFILRERQFVTLAIDLHTPTDVIPGEPMLVPAKQAASVIELKLAETVRNDRAIAEAAAKMNAGLSRSLLVSRMLTGFAITACLLVMYVVQHQRSTIQ